jgi:N-acetylglutamate synthase-like GNAT family acetyltransferase
VKLTKVVRSECDSELGEEFLEVHVPLLCAYIEELEALALAGKHKGGSAMIRVARLSDVVDLGDIEQAAFGPRVAWSVDDLRSEVEQGRVIVYHPPGVSKAVGYCSFKVRDGLGELTSVAVHPHWQRRGVGRALVQVAQARMQHAECVELDCDEPLELFYNRLGFDRCGQYTRGIGEKQVSRMVMRWVP